MKNVSKLLNYLEKVQGVARRTEFLGLLGRKLASNGGWK